MNRKLLAAGAAVAVVIVLLLMWLAGGSGKKKGESGGSGGAGRGGVVDPKHPERGGDGEANTTPTEDPWQPADPHGTLLLEGQVLDEDDQPVAGAQVWISSQPERTATTEADGSFSFDQLLPREYAVSARTADAIGGPVAVKVSAGMDPVVVRLREGAMLTVRVSGDDSAAVAGATVQLQEMGKPSATTGADGTASFRGLGSGYTGVEARAAGFAPTTALAMIGSPGSTQEVSITLRRGAAVSGTVLDENGQPAAHAWVMLQQAGAVWSPAIDGVPSGDDGSFKFAVVAQGSYVVVATHQQHAPGVSEIFSVDGSTSREGLEVRLAAPGVLRGRVVTSKRAPAPYASVETAGKNGQSGFAHVTADADGKFAIENLPRAMVRVHAENDEAGSAIVDVDLAKTPLVEDLELVLDVEGVIAGIVVDSKGEPIAEAQVQASVDFFKTGGEQKLEDLQFAGFTSATTDGGGRFRLRGLPDGEYLLWASRGGSPMQAYSTKGTSAKTGDTEVKIVLPAPGSIEGSIAFADGTIPKRATVQVGIMPATPAAADGEFSVRDLPPGTYDVHVRGPDFADVVKKDVEVKTGASTDVGTITVARGRTIAGRVVRPDGSPAAGARVLAGQILFSQGTSEGFDPSIEEAYGIRTAVVGADGAFLILGAPVQGGSIIAEDPSFGRSEGVPFAKGNEDVAGVTLQLRGFGAITGKVTAAGQPVGGAQVFATAKGSSGHMVVVNTLEDGTFMIEKVGEGDVKLTAGRGMGLSRETTNGEVHVTAGQVASAVLDFPVGTITLKVAIKGKNGVKIDAAEVVLFQGSVVVHNGKQMVDLALSGDQGNVTFWLGGADPAQFQTKQVPGEHTLCVIPINGNLSDTQFQQRLQEHMEDIAVYCQKAVLPENPDEQQLTATVPAMTPLPP